MTKIKKLGLHLNYAPLVLKKKKKKKIATKANLNSLSKNSHFQAKIFRFGEIMTGYAIKIAGFRGIFGVGG